MNITRRTIPSTNYDTSRKPIKQVVIHWIVGNLASADARFKKEGEEASAHYGVEDDRIYQWVDEAHTAYAVGVYYRNQETISIEHSASPDRLASTSTYSTSALLVADICKRHNIPIDKEYIIGHNQIKATQCPGTMDIDRIIREANSAIITQEIAQPQYLKTLLQENNLTNEGQVRDFFQKAINYPGLELDFNNAKKEIEKNREAYNKLLSQLVKADAEVLRLRSLLSAPISPDSLTTGELINLLINKVKKYLPT